MINCLENKRLIVRHVFKNTSVTLDKKHILYGGMLDGAVKVYSVPKTSAGTYVEVLTKDEESFLEEYMKLEPGTLSRYAKTNNYWDGYKVTLYKDDNYFDMSNPEDFIRIKVLLTNKEYICKSLKELQESPRVTYEFVIVDNNEVDTMNKTKITSTMEAYKYLGKIEDDTYKLRVVLQMLEKRDVSQYSTLEQLLNKINDHIVSSPKKFLEVVTDQYLNTKVLIKKAIDMKFIKDRGGLLYLAKNGMPLCEDGNPTIDVAARFLNMPKNAETKLELEMHVNEPERMAKVNEPTPDPLPLDEIERDEEEETKEGKGRKTKTK
ncbi:MAG: hypothetical protein J6N78_05190 [Clostridia bacterium]|nr:hypothetical protein [Clostridia bacterium]